MNTNQTTEQTNLFFDAIVRMDRIMSRRDIMGWATTMSALSRVAYDTHAAVPGIREELAERENTMRREAAL